jgi:cell division protein FtsX
MADDITLDLKKPLDKMTAKELRDLVIAKIPSIQGASGMDKEELLKAIKEVLGITEEEGGANPYKAQILGMKGQMKDLRAKKEAEGVSRKEKDIIRRKVNKLKKRTRNLAKAS